MSVVHRFSSTRSKTADTGEDGRPNTGVQTHSLGGKAHQAQLPSQPALGEASRGRPLCLWISRKELDQLGWPPVQPSQSPGKESRASPGTRLAVPGAQVLNSRKPPNAVPGALLFRTDPWVNSTHTLSPFCSSAIAKAVAVPPPPCSSAVLMGVRW